MRPSRPSSAVRSLALAAGLAVSVTGVLAVAGGVGSRALGDDPRADKPAKKTIDLVYRWDLLDGKTAVYDAELSSTMAVIRQPTTAHEDAGGDSSDAPSDSLESTTTTKQRLSMAFSKDDRGRGRVKVQTERLEISLTRLFLGTTETIHYDSVNPPKDGIPEKLRAMVDASMGKAYTLIVGRHGEVEGVEGRPASALESLKGTFLILPEKPRVEGDSWTQSLRQPADTYGDFVTKIAYKLARAQEGADAASSRLRIEATILTELDDRKSTLPREVGARVEGAKGEGHVDVDGRGLKLEEETSSQYSFVVTQVTLIQTTRFENRSRWKLVEVK